MAFEQIKIKIGGDASRYYSTLKQVKRATVNAGKLIAGAAVTAGVFSVREALAFGKGMAEVNTLAKLGQSDLEALGAKVRQLSVDMGLNLRDAVEGTYQAISAGVAPKDAIEFLGVAARAAIGGVTTLATAVDGITSVINAYGLEAKDASAVSDAFFQTIKLGKTRFEPLAESIGKVLPIAKNAGISFHEVFAALAEMTQQSGKTDEATTALRGAITQLISPTPALRAGLKKIKNTMTEADFEALSFQKTLALLADGVNGSASEMQKMFPDVRGLNLVLGLTGDRAEAAAAKLMELQNGTGAARDAFQEMDAATYRQFERLAAQIRDIGVTIGEAMLEPLKQVTNQLQQFVSNKQQLQGLVESFVAITTVIGTIAKLFLGLISLLRRFTLWVTGDSIVGNIVGLGLPKLATEVYAGSVADENARKLKSLGAPSKEMIDTLREQRRRALQGGPLQTDATLSKQMLDVLTIMADDIHKRLPAAKKGAPA